MPVVGEPVLAGVFAHGRDSNAVRQRDTAERDRREEVSSHAEKEGLRALLLLYPRASEKGQATRLKNPRFYMCFETHSTWRCMMSRTNFGSSGPCLVLG
jgi:hypothetical protein